MKRTSLPKQRGPPSNFIGGPMISTAEHAQVGGMGETNQTLSSLHRHLQPHTPMMRSNYSFIINNSR